MIASISGRIQEIDENMAVIEVGGIGVQTFIPTSTITGMHSGENVFLHTYLNVREDALTLYGFETKESREIFVLLLGVNGVGPKLALAILSTLTAQDVRRAILYEQEDVFIRVPGVGNKTSKKILLHMQDKIPVQADMEPFSTVSETDKELVDALTSLGYSLVEAQSALQSIPPDAEEDEEERLRLALQYFSSP